MNRRGLVRELPGLRCWGPQTLSSNGGRFVRRALTQASDPRDRKELRPHRLQPRQVPASLGFTVTRHWKVPRCQVNLGPCYIPPQVKRMPTDWTSLVSWLAGVETGMGDRRLKRRMHDERGFRNLLPTQLPARPSRRCDGIKTRPLHQRSVNKCKRFLQPFRTGDGSPVNKCSG